MCCSFKHQGDQWKNCWEQFTEVAKGKKVQKPFVNCFYDVSVWTRTFSLLERKKKNVKDKVAEDQRAKDRKCVKSWQHFHLVDWRSFQLERTTNENLWWQRCEWEYVTILWRNYCRLHSTRILLLFSSFTRNWNYHYRDD